MRTDRTGLTVICTRGPNSIKPSYPMEAHLQRAIPYLCQLVDAINHAGFIGVRIERRGGAFADFSVVPEKLAGHFFEGVVRAVAAGNVPPPIASVLIQLETANDAYEKWRSEYAAMNGIEP